MLAKSISLVMRCVYACVFAKHALTLMLSLV